MLFSVRFFGRLAGFVAGLLCICLTACNDEEDYVYPSIISEFVVIYTDEDASFHRFVTDSQQNYIVRNEIHSSDTLARDSAYRCICRYLVHPDTEPKEATIYALQSVCAPLPVPTASVQEIHTDPVSLQSIWRGGEYLNLSLLVKAQNKKHTYRFMEDSLVQSGNGKKNLYLTLYHDAGGDMEAYTQNVYLSIPLYPYRDCLYSGDTISLRINTKQEGWTVWNALF